MNSFLGYIVHETQKAILFWDHFWHCADWMPKSQIIINRSDETVEVEVVATNWICEVKGVEEFKERENDDDAAE